MVSIVSFFRTAVVVIAALMVVSAAQAQTPDTDGTLVLDGGAYNTFFQEPDVVWLQVDHAGGDAFFDTRGSEFNTKIGLYNDSGDRLGVNDDAVSTLSSLEISGLESGTYYLAVAGSNYDFMATDFGVSDLGGGNMGTLNVSYRSTSQVASISGVITLPGDPATEDISFALFVSPSEFTNFLPQASLLLSEGTSEISYAISYFTQDSGSFVFELFCASGCGSILSGFYTQNGLIFDFNQASIPAGAVPTEIDIELTIGETLSGNLMLPAGEAADPIGLSSFVRLLVFDEVNNLIDEFSVFPYVSGDESQVEYNLNYLPAPATGRYELEFGCSFDCGALRTSHFYTAGGTVFDRNSASIAEQIFPETADLQLENQPIVSFSATVESPLGSVGAEVGVYVSVDVYDSDGMYLTTSQQSGTIMAQELSVDIALEAVDVADGSYVVSYGCEFNCGNLLPEQFYTPVGTVFEFFLASVSRADLPASDTLLLTEGLGISGTIGLAASEVAGAEGVNAQVSIIVFDENNNQIGTTSSFPFIPEGSNNEPFDLVFPPAGSNGTYAIEFTCSMCDDLEVFNYYTPSGTVSDINQAKLLEGNLPVSPALVLTAPPALSIPGNLSIEQGVAVGDISALIAVEIYDVNFNFIDSSSSIVTIPDGSSTVPYTIDTQSIPGATYAISFSCSSNCSEFLNRGFYTPEGTQYIFTRVGFDELPSNVDFSFEIGQLFSGIVTLPSGTASGDIAAFVSVNTFPDSSGFNSNGFFTTRVVIPDGESQIPFQFMVQNLDSGTYQIRYSCDNFNSGANCGTLVTSELYYTASGEISFSFSDSATRLSTLPSPVTLGLIEGQSLEGQISLPAEFVANRDVVAAVNVIALDLAGNSVGSAFDTFTIPNGADSIPYSLNLPPLTSGNYVVGFYCAEFASPENCDGLFSNTAYSVDGGVTFDFNDAFIPSDELPASADLTLLTGQRIQGNLFLQDGEQAVDSIFTSVSVRVLDSANEEVGVQQSFPSIDPMQSTAAYNISFPTSSEFSYQIEYSCDFNCPQNTIRTLYYTPTGTTEDGSSAILSSGDIPENLDLQFETRQTRVISGEISLPSGGRVEDTGYYLTITVYDENQFFLSNVRISDVIDAGDTSVPFAIEIPDLTTGSVTVQYGCESNCGTILSEIYYTADGARYRFDFNEILVSIDGVPDPFNLVLEEGVPFSGTVSLPSGTAAGEINTFVSVNGYTGDGDFLYGAFTNLSIAAGSSQAEFEVGLPPIAAGQVIVNYGCSSNCGDLFQTVFYTPSGSVFGFLEGFFDAAQLPAVANLELVEGRRIEATITLDGGATAIGADIQAFASVRSIESNGGQAFISSAGAIILADDSSASFSLLLPKEDSTKVLISTRCFDGTVACQGFTLESFYTPAGPIYRFGPEAEVTVGEVPDPLNLTLRSGRMVNFQGRVPDSPVIDEFTRILTTIQAIDASDEVIGTQESTIFVSPNSPFDVELTLIEAGAGGRYEITFVCDASTSFDYDCSGFQITDPSYSFTLDADSVPNPIVLQLLERMITPDLFEVDNTDDVANEIQPNSVQKHNIHEAGDIDWVKFTIEDGIDSLAISAVQGPTDEALAITLLDSNLNEIRTAAYPNGSDLNPPRQFAQLTFGPVPVGSYLVKVEAINPSYVVEAYDLTLEMEVEEEDEELCIPIPTKNGAVTLICI